MSSISSAISQLSNDVQAAATAKTASTSTASANTATGVSNNLKDDTVKLSMAAQAKMMHRQGLSPSIIAANLGTNVAAVDDYLNIKIPTQAASAASIESASTSPSAATT